MLSTHYAASNGRPPRAKLRGVALLATFILASLAVATPAHAAPMLAGPAYAAPGAPPKGPFRIEITKLEQPDALQQPANGLPIVDASAVSPPVAGATFSTWPVPGIDLLTSEGQQQAATLTVQSAASLVDTNVPPAASDTSDTHGNASLTGLAAGLYYVVETQVPTGFVGAAPFLVALPLTNPETGADWLSTVHVYPKNARVGISLDPVDERAVSLGDTVEWVSRADIPVTASLDGYRVVQRIDPRLRLTGASAGGALEDILVAFASPGAPKLTRGTHYSVNIDAQTQEITVDFLPSGLALLAQYAQSQPGALLEVRYTTEALSDGEIENQALLYPSRAAVNGDPGQPDPPRATAVTKWGPIAVRVHERGNQAHPIAGATFEVYLSEDDARARTNAVEVGGVHEWTSDADGMLRITGLRFSSFVNGLDRQPSDPLFRYFYVVPTSFPEGWTGEKTPLRTTVTSASEVTVLEVVLWRANSGGAGGAGELSMTGGQVTGAALLGALLLGGGLLVLVQRRRRVEDDGGLED